MPSAALKAGNAVVTKPTVVKSTAIPMKPIDRRTNEGVGEVLGIALARTIAILVSPKITGLLRQPLTVVYVTIASTCVQESSVSYEVLHIEETIWTMNALHCKSSCVLLI